MESRSTVVINTCLMKSSIKLSRVMMTLKALHIGPLKSQHHGIFRHQSLPVAHYLRITSGSRAEKPKAAQMLRLPEPSLLQEVSNNGKKCWLIIYAIPYIA